jgi:hypothetical protein
MYFQLAFPKRITLETTEEDYKKATGLINKHNGSTPVYKSIYYFTDYPNGENAIIDKLFFDFDYDKNDPDKAHNDLYKLHQYFLDKNIKHVALFSGNGFHLFAFVKPMYPGTLNSINNTLKNAYSFFENELGISFDKNARDSMRVARVPGTINIKTGLHSIFLNQNTIKLKRHEIMAFAKEPTDNSKHYFGEEELDIKEFDKEIEVEFIQYEIDERDIDDDVVLSQLPKCLASSLLDGECGYNARYAIITAMRDLLIPREVANKTLKAHLTPDKYRHCIYQENQLNYLYSREDLLCPSCNTLKNNGLCVLGCSGYNIYY